MEMQRIGDESAKEKKQKNKRKVGLDDDNSAELLRVKKKRKIKSHGEVRGIKETSVVTQAGDEDIRTEEDNDKNLQKESEMEETRDSKKKRKEKKNRDESESGAFVAENLKDDKTREAVNEKEGGMKKKKIKGDKKAGFDAKMVDVTDGKEVGNKREELNVRSTEKVEDSLKETKKTMKKNNLKDDSRDKKLTSNEKSVEETEDGKDTERVEGSQDDKKKKKKNRVLNDLGTEDPTNYGEISKKKVGNEEMDSSNDKKKKRKKKNYDLGAEENNEDSTKDTKKKKKEKKKQNDDLETEENTEESNRDMKKKRKKKKQSENVGAENPSPNGSARKVTFSDHVEVFPLSDTLNAEENDQEEEDDGLVRGKRFSKEEDEIIKKAVLEYIESHNLGDDGVEMVMNSKSHPEVKNCWKEIGVSIPWRPSISVYYRAHILFERDSKRSWTPEELEQVKTFAEKHGSNWKMLADAIGKHRVHIKDAWRRIKFPNMKKGQWTREEYQTLFDLVNIDIKMKAFEEKKSKHGMLRDNIPWSAISDKLGTRNHSLCCMKWYGQLTSSMVEQGIWDNADDYRLLDALMKLDACCIEDVEWDNLLENRSGDVCRKRWNQMVPHIGQPGTKSFAEQVEILSQRYCPDLAELREEFDNQPVVP